MIFSLSCSTCPAPLSPPQRQMGGGRVVLYVLSSPLTSAHSSTHGALCCSSRHRHEGHIKMHQDSSGYLSLPQIHLSAFKQQSMQLTEKCFLLPSTVTRATQLLDRTTDASTVINTVQQDRRDFLWKDKRDSTPLSPFYC